MSSIVQYRPLTPTTCAAILFVAGTSSTGSRNLVTNGEKSPHSLAAFLCPSFSAAIGRVIRYGGVIWAAFGAGCSIRQFSTPLHATAHDVEIIGGVHSTLME